MTVPAGHDRYGAALDPQSRADLGKPQGLKSAPPIPNPSYPHLGFNPVPGDTETVRGLGKKLSGCAKVLQEAYDLVTKLLDGSYWKGDAAVAFREQLDGGPLPLNLKNAAHSVRKAARQLDRWEGELDDFQRRAKKLEDDAKDAQAVVDRAQGRADTAGRDPGLEQEGAEGDAAQKALTRANGDLDDARSELKKIIGKAKRLAEEHEEKAGYRARKIRDATKKLVPHEPGLFDEVLDWLGDNLPDILSFVAGLIGVVALLFAGPLGLATVAALMLVASGLSATALGLRLNDPEVRASLVDGITKGELDADFWSNTVSVGADFMGVLPGLGAVAKGSTEATQAIRRGEQSLGFWHKVSVYGSKSIDEAGQIAGLENGLIARAVRGVRDPEKAANAVSLVSGVAGVGTGGIGLYDAVVDADDDGIKDGAVAGIDGSRLILDNGGIIGLVRHVF
ncbi:putative T7SS-secreted protein [Streptomyces sp. NPDC048187]|uniref:putative T7SS-secreted protein n=1 Tax=Streptomyces sp. NPDC048187 TaxID=3365509 RepID=UPI00371F4DDA